MGWIGCIHCQSLWCEFMARTFELIAPVQPVLHWVSCSNETLPNAPKQNKTHQNMTLRSNGVDRVCSLQKISMQLRGTNFCTSSKRFAPSFVRLPNGHKCTQMVQNAPKHEFRVQWSGSSWFAAKNSDATSWHKTNFCIISVRFSPSLVRQPNGPKCAQMVRNAPKHEYRVQWGGSGVFVAKNSNAISWHKLLH